MADKSFVNEDISTWEQLYYPPGGASQQPVAYTKRNISYTASPNVLQNLTLHVPIFGHNHKTLATLREEDQTGTWIIYVHGGAWRDPKITAASFDNGAAHLLSPTATDDLRKSGAALKIAGVASLNYSLSPHPEHPFSDANQSDQRARSAVHPQHLIDVLSAVHLLQSQLNFGSRYILIGHSCGSAMVLQAGGMLPALRASLQIPAEFPAVEPPRAIIGLNGLYDLPALVHRPGTGFEHLKEEYASFVAGAFGPEDRAWAVASPAVARTADGEHWAPHWPGSLLVVVHSPEDELVSVEQANSMIVSLGCKVPEGGWAYDSPEREQAFMGKTLVVDRATRTHHAIWEDSEELAGIILRAVGRVGGTA